MLRAVLLTFCLFIAPYSLASTADLSLVGKGTMRWLFFDLYDAEFFSIDKHYQNGQYPVALSLTYKRNISRHDLVQTTREEWHRLGLEVEHSIDLQLAAIWQDVAPNDKLTFRANSKNQGEFYLNGEPIGSIEHPNFSQHFLAIWLSPNSRDKKLRAKLIGADNA